MSYNPYYASGWLTGETGATPITPDALNHMDTGITDAHTAAASAQTKANAAMPKSGGAMTGYLTTKGIKLTSGTDYGTSLPAAGNAGRLFFKKA